MRSTSCLECFRYSYSLGPPLNSNCSAPLSPCQFNDIGSLSEITRTLGLLIGTSKQLKEDVEVALVLAPSRHPRLLEQVVVDVGSSNGSNGIEEDPDELALYTARALTSCRAGVGTPQTHETRRVVVLDGLSVSKRFQDGVGLEDLSFELTELLPGSLVKDS